MIGIQRLFRKLRKKNSGNDGFTLVELMVVTGISLVILAGIVVLLRGTFDILKSNRNLLATTDSSRRALSTVSRQLREALHIVNGAGESDTDTLTYYADVRGENYGADVNYTPNWENAPKIKWWFDAVNGVFKQTTTDPGKTEGTEANIASNVKELKFEYYPSGSNSPVDSPQDLDINKITTRIRITVKVQKGETSRTLFQDVFLRVTKRIPEQEVVLISSVSPSSVSRHWSGTVTITGVNTNFAQGQSVISFLPTSPYVYVDPSTVTVISKTQLTATVYVDDFSGAGLIFEVHVDTGTETPFPLVGGFRVN